MARRVFLIPAAAVLVCVGFLVLRPRDARETALDRDSSVPASSSHNRPATLPILPREAGAPPVLNAPLAVTGPRVLPESFEPGIIAHWQGRLATPINARAPAPEDDFHLPLRFALPLDERRSVSVLIQRFDVTGPNSGVFTGIVDQRTGSIVILSYVGGAQAGVVHLPDENRSFVITGDSEGHVRITENDLARAPGCTPPLVPPVGS